MNVERLWCYFTEVVGVILKFRRQISSTAFMNVAKIFEQYCSINETSEIMVCFGPLLIDWWK